MEETNPPEMFAVYRSFSNREGRVVWIADGQIFNSASHALAALLGKIVEQYPEEEPIEDCFERESMERLQLEEKEKKSDTDRTGLSRVPPPVVALIHG